MNPILDWDLAGPMAAATPDLEPAVTGPFVVENLLSLGFEYHENFGSIAR